MEPLVLKKLKMVLQQKLIDDINQEEDVDNFLKCQRSTCTIKNNYLYWKDLHIKISDY